MSSSTAVGAKTIANGRNPIYNRFFAHCAVISGKEGRNYKDRIFRKQLVAANLTQSTGVTSWPVPVAAAGPALFQHYLALKTDVIEKGSDACFKKKRPIMSVGEITNSFIKFLF